MIPNWQMIGIFILVLMVIAVGVYSSPNSYAYLSITGQCERAPMLAACHPIGRAFGGRVGRF